MLFQICLPVHFLTVCVPAAGQRLKKLRLSSSQSTFPAQDSSSQGSDTYSSLVEWEQSPEYTSRTVVKHTPGPKRLVPHLYLTLYGLTCSQQAAAGCSWNAPPELPHSPWAAAVTAGQFRHWTRHTHPLRAADDITCLGSDTGDSLF